MSLTYPSFEELDSERFAELKELLTSVLQEYNSDVDLRRGTVHDLVLHARSLLAAASETAVSNALLSSSLTELIADPTIADTDAVDRLLGNYRITRNPGSQASGSVTVVLSSLTPVVISGGTVITISGVEFTTETAFAARTSSISVVNDSDRLISAVVGGYAFVVDVVAVNEGSSGNVKRGSTATFDQEPVNFVKAFATSDFIGGADEDTNQVLVNKLQTGLAVRAWSNRPSVEAVLREQEDFAGIKSTSVIGFLDGEMLRDQHSIFPISSGGRADLYVRSESTYQTVTITKTATLISKAGSVGTWQFGLSKTDAPAYYDIVKILLPTADPVSGGFAPTSEVRSIDMSGSGWKPEVQDVIEGVYSAYQAAVVQFEDTTTNATALTVGVSQASYDVVVRLMPLIADIQDFWNLVDNRPTMGDVLVKAPIPCFVTAGLTLQIRRGYTVSAATVSQAVSDAINGLGFSGSLAASYINQVIHNLLPNELVSISSSSLSGRIRKPDDTATTMTSSTLLSIEDDFENMVSGRTVAFLTEPSAIAVTLVTVDPPSV